MYAKWPISGPLPYTRLGELELLEMAFEEAIRIDPPVPVGPEQGHAAKA
jgi:hypothetical protein